MFSIIVLFVVIGERRISLQIFGRRCREAQFKMAEFRMPSIITAAATSNSGEMPHADF